jgi:Zn-dependent protease
LPFLLIISHAGFVIGWAKPVPYNPDNLRNIRKGTFLVAIMGIIANIIIAIAFGLLIRFATVFGLPAYTTDPILVSPFYNIASIIVLTNLVLALFNMIPIPPLDGSKILFALLPPHLRHVENFLQKWGMFILLFFILFLWQKVAPIIFIAFSFLTGLH